MGRLASVGLALCFGLSACADRTGQGSALESYVVDAEDAATVEPGEVLPEASVVEVGGPDTAETVPDVAEFPPEASDTSDTADAVVPKDRPWSDGLFLRDAHGRVMMLNGVNAGSKNPPDFFPSGLSSDDFARMRAAGFDVVRLLILWEALEPAKGQYDDTYLDRMDQVIGWAANAGLLVILDMHQDVWGRKFGGDGAPVWATIDDGLAFDNQGPWWAGYLQPACRRAFASFWADRDGVRQAFIDLWVHVATRYRDDPRILGYECLNEPDGGEFGTADEFAKKGLTPFYDALMPALRAVDSRHLIFFEPESAANPGTVSAVAPAMRDDVVYMPHYYPPGVEILSRYDGDVDLVKTGLAAHAQTAAGLGVPWLLGEWMSLSGWEGSEQFAWDVPAAAESQMAGWAYWEWGGTLGDWHLDALARARPMRIAGTPIGWSSDLDGRFELTWVEPQAAGDAPTEVFLPPARYPAGWIAEGVADSDLVTPLDTRPGVVAMRSSGGSAKRSVVFRPAAAPFAPGLSSHVSPWDPAQRAQEFDLAAAAGLTLIRRDFIWAEIEPTKGDFHFEGYDAIVNDAAAKGLEVVALLAYGNGWAYGPAGGESALDPDAFAAFAAACAGHFEGRVRLFEVWNEENLAQFWHPDPDPTGYGKLLRAASVAIRAECPDCKVLFGGMSSHWPAAPSEPWAFLEQVWRVVPDLSRLVDIIAIHPYSAVQMAAPEQDLIYGSTTALVRSARHIEALRGVFKPLWVTEFGWPAAPAPPAAPEVDWIPNVSLDDQARYLVRGFVMAAAGGSDAVMWYTTFDGDGGAQPPSENYFGLMQYDPAPGVGVSPVKKPSYQAATVLSMMLARRHWTGEGTAPEGVRAELFGPSADAAKPGTVAVVWAPDGDVDATFAFGQDGAWPQAVPSSVRTMAGGFADVVPVTGGFRLKAGPDPLYLQF